MFSMPDFRMSQDEPIDYLTPQDAPGGFMPAYAIASPSPIKKKSRCSRGSRDLVVPDNVDEEEDEDEELGPLREPGAPLKSFCSSTNEGDEYGNDFRNLSQGLSQSVLEGLGSLKVNGSSPEDEDMVQSSQEGAQGFCLKSVGWGHDEAGDEGSQDSTRRDSRATTCTDADEEEITQVISIPVCRVNPFDRPAGGEGRKRQRQRKIKIPLREGGSSSVSRYLMDFDQIDTIGNGRFSMVYKCRGRLDGWVYAVKCSKHSLTSPLEQETAMREVFALAALQGCPHLVRYQGAWFEDSRVYIVTEFCPGGSLESAVFPAPGASSSQWARQHQDQQGAVFRGSESELLRVARDVGAALAFMHARGVVHMDVKPANIFVAGDGSFKLGDLGHAIKCDGSMLVEEGDDRYLSAEVLKGLDLLKLSKGAEVPDYQAILAPNDMFGLGASLYEIATRHRLTSAGPEFHRLREGQLRPIPGMSSAFQTLLRHMLASSASQRPTAQQVVAAAEEILEASPNGVVPGEPAKLVARYERRIQDLEKMVVALSS